MATNEQRPIEQRPIVVNRIGQRNPCGRDCPDRKSECHSTCEKWQAWEQLKKEAYKEREGDLSVMDARIAEQQKASKARMRKTNGKWA